MESSPIDGTTLPAAADVRVASAGGRQLVSAAASAVRSAVQWARDGAAVATTADDAAVTAAGSVAWPAWQGQEGDGNACGEAPAAPITAAVGVRRWTAGRMVTAVTGGWA